MTDAPDPRYLGGNDTVLTDVANMAWVVAVGWDGAADIHANVDKPTMIAQLRFIADKLEADGT